MTTVSAPRVQVVEAGRIADVGADRIAALLRAAIERRGAASLALAGGSTPEPVYRRLATRPLPWDRVDVFFGDERAVPRDDVRSNYRMVRGALLDRLPLPPRSVHRMEAEREDRDEAAAEYAALLPARLDVLLLGIGEEGHTASLFPGSPALDERIRRVVPARAPEPPDRLTITPPVIEAAAETLVLATGARKAVAVRRALGGDDPVAGCPARLARGGLWLLDRQAAAEWSAASSS